MHLAILGSGAGGGVPQWNCRCPTCRDAQPRTQAQFAASADGEHWLLIGASPDLRHQILATPELLPPPDTRDSPIGAVVLISADVDGIAGLLTLREGHKFALYAPPAILAKLAASPIFNVLAGDCVRRIPLAANTPCTPLPGLELTLLELPGKAPLYEEAPNQTAITPAPTYAARLIAEDRRALIAPNCAVLTPALRAEAKAAHVVLFDGTFFTETEMPSAGLGHKTASRMGHVPVQASLPFLASLSGRRYYVHINNSNPMLLPRSPQALEVQASGCEIATDGCLISV